ncbi:MAG: tetratricopeptide repeat protein [Ignavibacteriae bacterium]|nr:tetratricopeptide repeat protein [Ignavibacteriota bacterium]
MLKPKKKITKKEIKQDGLVTAYAEATSFYYEHKKHISYVVTALVVMIVAVVIYINNRRANNEKAAVELGKVYSIIDAAASDSRQFKIAIDGQPERGIMGLKSIVENYGGTESGELARFYLANAYFNIGLYDEALKQYEEFSTDNELLHASTLAGIGRCYEAKKEYSTAATYLEKAANAISNSSVTPEYLSSAARCYALAGDKEKAITLYKRIKKEYSTSKYGRDADRYIGQFST